MAWVDKIDTVSILLMPDNLSGIESVKTDAASFQEIVEKNRDSVYRFAFAITTRHHLAEEVSQEAFIKLWKSLRSGAFDRTKEIYPWLRTVCLNIARDYLSGEKRRIQIIKNMTASINPADGAKNNTVPAAELDESKEKVSQAIESLEPERRAVLALRIIEGLSYKEISRQLNCSIGTVMSRLFRARMELKEKLKI